MAAVAVAPTLVEAKVADQLAAAAKGMAADGQVERVIHPAEGAAMHRLAVVKSRFGAGLAERFIEKGTRK